MPKYEKTSLDVWNKHKKIVNRVFFNSQEEEDDWFMANPHVRKGDRISPYLLYGHKE